MARSVFFLTLMLVLAASPAFGQARQLRPSRKAELIKASRYSSFVLVAGNVQVQDELGLDADQIQVVNDLAAENRQVLSMAFPKPGGPPVPDRLAARRKFSEKAEAKLREILIQEQLTRLNQIWMQHEGPKAMRYADIAAQLELTEEQVAKTAEINNRSVLREEGDDPKNWHKQKQMAKDAEMLAVLTDEQRAKWKEMLGAPFVKKDSEQTGSVPTDSVP
ncbi:MAG TPA: hypothetical protein VHC22_14950 [Pirellulales bacterium]|nr:hypothetical protein [Pirellulales bacterium]